jgi:hypothetical protein
MRFQEPNHHRLTGAAGDMPDLSFHVGDELDCQVQRAAVDRSGPMRVLARVAAMNGESDLAEAAERLGCWR